MAEHLRLKTKWQHPSLRQSTGQSLLLPRQRPEVSFRLGPRQQLHYRDAWVRARSVHELRGDVLVGAGERNREQGQVCRGMCQVPGLPDAGEEQSWETVFY